MSNRKPTDYQAAQKAVHQAVLDNTDGTYNEGIATVATAWVCLLMTCYKGDHAKVVSEMENTVATVKQGFLSNEFGHDQQRLH